MNSGVINIIGKKKKLIILLLKKKENYYCESKRWSRNITIENRRQRRVMIISRKRTKIINGKIIIFLLKKIITERE